MDPHALQAARAALDWLIELGADEAIGEAPVDRTALPQRLPDRTPPTPPQAQAAPSPSAPPALKAPAEPRAALARRLAEAAPDLAALAAAMEGVEDELKAGARRFVFADGTPGAPLMVVGEAPGRDEDREGRPFVGPAGQLLDRMLAAIGRDRADPDSARAVYVANVLPWRPPGNRQPTDAEVAAWAPFLRRHVALAAPRILLIAGNTPARALLGQAGITRLRGQWRDVEAGGATLPAMPTFHPSYVLRLEDRPTEHKAARAQVWADLQAVQARLRETP